MKTTTLKPGKSAAMSRVLNLYNGFVALDGDKNRVDLGTVMDRSWEVTLEDGFPVLHECGTTGCFCGWLPALDPDHFDYKISCRSQGSADFSFPVCLWDLDNTLEETMEVRAMCEEYFGITGNSKDARDLLILIEHLFHKGPVHYESSLVGMSAKMLKRVRPFVYDFDAIEEGSQDKHEMDRNLILKTLEMIANFLGYDLVNA